ncbi:MAG: hypothetical protein RLZZ507_738 [Cyanobacteriota bacterium]|jgi:hypothetical protein
MLFVNPEQVKYCQLTQTIGDKLKTIAGISYGDKLFIKLHSFPKEEKQAAIEKAKAISLENKGHFLIILVEEKTDYVIWQENDQVKQKSDKIQDMPVAEINLKSLVNKMRNEKGINIKDHWYNLRVYHHCFLGSEAVAWLIEYLKISHEKAMGIGKRLIAEKWIHPLNNEHDFKDENVLYRFYVDEKSEPKQPDKQMLDTDKIKKLFSLS